MNIIAKLKAMQREIEALRARVEALEPKAGYSYGEPFTIDEPVELRPLFASDDPGELPAKWREPLTAPIVDAKSIASATIAPPPKKRGRPPKAT